MFLRFDDILPKEKPSLLHGNLWLGNLMYINGMSPVFIDPAIYFGNREMDIAMTQMFGGFRLPSILYGFISLRTGMGKAIKNS